MEICNTALQLIGTVVFVAILRNPNVISRDFITYMADLFTITPKQFETWIVGGGIFIFMLSAAINVFDGFRKTRIR
ncbi:hypothetical protein ELQ35_20420 [Peribacillus cavernae]|uniref:Uncharacterized protein n=1 Tax=Peribacillus cavernae TaxID=1674310 RepID=A0A433H9Z2_9BACI|nr:hypothetical protein [Peribacillus cavernae]RUQ25149.1 hypothetical protein ELQ35_20420 [Peribacillus cavernae]